MPKVRYHWPIGLSILGLSLWAVVTLGAEALLPWVLEGIDRVEVYLELDHSRAPAKKS